MEARALGRGGIARVAEATGLSRATSGAGLQELAAGPEDDDAAGRLRGPGAGRKALAEHDAGLEAALERLVDHDTAPFAVETLRRWWRRMGCVSYPVARRLLITADGGGSNGSRHRLLEVGVAAVRRRDGVAGLGVQLSAWDEQVKQDRAPDVLSHHGELAGPAVGESGGGGEPDRIGHTTTRSGLAIRSELDENSYPTGQPVTAEQMESLSLKLDKFHGD